MVLKVSMLRESVGAGSSDGSQLIGRVAREMSESRRGRVLV